MKVTVTRSVRIPVELDNALKELAVKLDRSVNYVIISAIRNCKQHIDSENKPLS